MNINEMARELQRRLKRGRFVHSVGVANTAVKLAKRFGADICSRIFWRNLSGAKTY